MEEHIFDPLLLAPAGMLFTLIILGWVVWISRIEHRHKMEKQRGKLNSEVMAYVAEGTISVDDAERLLRAMNEPDTSIEQFSTAIRARAAAPHHPN